MTFGGTIGVAETALVSARLWTPRIGLLAAVSLGTGVGYVYQAGWC